MRRFAVGIDVGGTNIKVGLVNQAGNVVSRNNLNTKSYISNKQDLVNALCDSINRLIFENKLSKKNIAGVGVGLPGLLDPLKGHVIFLPNIPGWRNVPFTKILKKKLQFDTFIDNDVNLITLAEWKYGAGQGSRNMICMTLGTGIGSGLILDGALYRGEGYVAGEIGHIPIKEKGPQCNCGGIACFERYLGNKYLQKRAARIFRAKNITLEEVTSLALKGNKRAVRFWDDVAGQIGYALTGPVNLLNPAKIVIGGGVSNCPSSLMKRVQETIKSRAMQVQGKMVKVVKARLKNDAGIIGAHVLVNDSLALRKRK